MGPFEHLEGVSRSVEEDVIDFEEEDVIDFEEEVAFVVFDEPIDG